MWLFVTKIISEPAQDESRGAVEVVEQVQRESKDCEGEALAMVEETIEFVIENRDDCK